MQKIKTAAVIGAGALGLLYQNKIAATIGADCYFIADSDRYEKLKRAEYSINGSTVKPAVKHKDDISGKPDLLILAVKNYNLEEVLGLLKASVKNDSIIISVLNGINSETFLEEHFPAARIIYTVSLGMDAVKEGNVLSYTNEGRLIVGTRENDKKSPHLFRLTDSSEAADLPLRFRMIFTVPSGGNG